MADAQSFSLGTPGGGLLIGEEMGLAVREFLEMLATCAEHATLSSAHPSKPSSSCSAARDSSSSSHPSSFQHPPSPAFAFVALLFCAHPVNEEGRPVDQPFDPSSVPLPEGVGEAWGEAIQQLWLEEWRRLRLKEVGGVSAREPEVFLSLRGWRGVLTALYCRAKGESSSVGREGWVGLMREGAVSTRSLGQVRVGQCFDEAAVLTKMGKHVLRFPHFMEATRKSFSSPHSPTFPLPTVPPLLAPVGHFRPHHPSNFS